MIQNNQEKVVMDPINEPSTSSYVQPIAVVATLAIGVVVTPIVFRIIHEAVTDNINFLIATAVTLKDRVAQKLQPAKPFLPTVGVIAIGTLFRWVVAENIYWLFSSPTHWMATAVTLAGRGLLTWQLCVGTKDILIGAKDLLTAQPINTLSGDALTEEKNRIQTQAMRMQQCAKVIGAFSATWLAFGLCGLDAGDLSPWLVPMSTTTLGLTGTLIASLSGVYAWFLAKSVHSALILPAKAADDTLLTLVPKVLTAARTNHHIPAIGNTDTAQLRRATIGYLLVAFGVTDARDILGAFNVDITLFQQAHTATSLDMNPRNQSLQRFIEGAAAGFPAEWTTLAEALDDNRLLSACVECAAR
jgi:hypothetical protein